MVELTLDANGWGKANQQAWKDAAQGAIEAENALLKYGDKQREIANQGVEDFKGNAAARQAEIQQLIAQKAVVDKLVDASSSSG